MLKNYKAMLLKCISDFSPVKLTFSIFYSEICLHMKNMNMYIFSFVAIVAYGSCECGLHGMGS